MTLTVHPPQPGDMPIKLPRKIVEDGALSEAQLETILMAETAFASDLPGKFVLDDGDGTERRERTGQADRARDILDALDLMAEVAAQCYEAQTGAAFLPAAGGRRGKLAHLTGAVFEARQWLEAHERQQAEQFKINGTPLAIAGDRDWMDIDAIWGRLDRIRDRFRESYDSDLILYHKADRKGVDAIAAAWARSRKVPQVTFQPNWRAFGKSAGFKAIDQMLDTPKPLGGVVIFGSAGIALNLADKAEAKGIKAMRVARPEHKDT